jgi:hypothetical protein
MLTICTKKTLKTSTFHTKNHFFENIDYEFSLKPLPPKAEKCPLGALLLTCTGAVGRDPPMESFSFGKSARLMSEAFEINLKALQEKRKPAD